MKTQTKKTAKRAPKSRKYHFRIVLACEITALSDKEAVEVVEALEKVFDSKAPLKIAVEDVEDMSD